MPDTLQSVLDWLNPFQTVTESPLPVSVKADIASTIADSTGNIDDIKKAQYLNMIRAGATASEASASAQEVEDYYNKRLDELTAQGFGDILPLPSKPSLLVGSVVIIIILVLIAFILFEVK